MITHEQIKGNLTFLEYKGLFSHVNEEIGSSRPACRFLSVELLQLTSLVLLLVYFNRSCLVAQGDLELTMCGITSEKHCSTYNSNFCHTLVQGSLGKNHLQSHVFIEQSQGSVTKEQSRDWLILQMFRLDGDDERNVSPLLNK